MHSPGRFAERVFSCSRPFVTGILAFLLLESKAQALDPDKRLSQFAHTAWRTQDGVLNGTAFAFTQTSDGYLWVGTGAGLLRFDGVKFTRFESIADKSLPGGSVTAILGASGGSLWIGTNGGLFRWSDQKLTAIPEVHGRVDAIIEDHSKNIWAAQISSDQSGPLCEIADNRAKCFERPDRIVQDSGCCDVVGEDANGDVWGAGRTVILRHHANHVKQLANPALTKESPINTPAALIAGNDGAMLMGYTTGGPGFGLQEIKDGHWAPIRRPTFDGSKIAVGGLYRDRNEALWIGTPGNGLLRVTKNRVEHFDSRDGLSGDTVWRIYEDQEGTFWIATDAGIDSFRETPITSYSTKEGISNDSVSTVVAARDGGVWIGSGGGLDYVRGGTVESLRPGAGLPGQQVTSMLDDQNAGLWVGVESGLWLHKGHGFTQVVRPDGKELGIVTGISEDADSNIWALVIGPPRTLMRIRNLKVQELVTPPGIPPSRKVAAASDGLWLGALNGDLAHFEHGRTESYSPGVPEATFANQLVVDADGAVLTANGYGLLRRQGGEQHILSMQNGLPCNSINAVVADRDRNLWLYADCGLLQVTRSELSRWWAEPDRQVRYRTFDVFDGFRSGFALFNGATMATDGRLWFANDNVAQVIDPHNTRTNRYVPPVHIETLLVNHKEVALTGDVELPPRTRSVEIHYTGLSLAVPQKVLFRYRLEGHDTTWEDVGTRRQAFYNDLPPGRYQFRVIACNNDGVWNEVGATLDFNVQPAWYQTAWFRLLCGLSVAMTLTLLYRLRVRQIAQYLSARLEERIAERTRIARELHDTLLQSVQALILNVEAATLKVSGNDPETAQAREALKKALDRAEEVISEGRSRVLDLRSGVENSTDLTQLLSNASKDLAAEGGVPCTMVVEGEVRALHPRVRDELFWIGREALQNAVNHARPRAVEVQCIFASDTLRIRIRDDGAGFDLNDASVATRPGHWGLKGMNERAASIGAKVEIWSRSGAGTEIEVSVPARIAYLTRRQGWFPWSLGRASGYFKG